MQWNGRSPFFLIDDNGLLAVAIWMQLILILYAALLVDIELDTCSPFMVTFVE